MLGDECLGRGGTGVSALMRGLATLPNPRWIQEPSVVRDRDGRPQEDLLAVHCFCVCSGSALLGDLLGVSRSRECDLLSALLISSSSSSLYLFHSHNAVKIRQKNIKTFGMKKDNKAQSALTVDPYTTRHNSVNCTSIKYKL